MASSLLQQVLKQVEQLTPEERLELIHRVVESLRKPELLDKTELAKRRVSDFYGIAPDLLERRDAQEWVNELRNEWSIRET